MSDLNSGGFGAGGNADERYHMTYIVQNSVQSGNPIIPININYRLSVWGVLYGEEVQNSGVTNLGLRDQRLALHWVQENVAAFDGKYHFPSQASL